MGREKVLVEFEANEPADFEMIGAAALSDAEAARQAGPFLDRIAGMGVELEEHAVPVRMMIGRQGGGAPQMLANLARGAAHDLRSETVVLAAEVPEGAMGSLRATEGVKVWPNSELTLYADATPAAITIDCRPFKPAVEIAVLRDLLSVQGIWNEGRRGQGIVVGIIDEGVDGATYPVIGGFARPDAGLRPGEASVQSHGSMCAADILVAAPDCKLYDYPFLGIPNSGGALQMFQAVLAQRAIDGTPHITNNSFGFVGVPDAALIPDHEVHNPNHPLHRKVREVVASGVACFFAAGNCGADCPSGKCDGSGIGPGRSIHASNSLVEVITVAAVNSLHERIGYSSQGPGVFEAQKPDIASYSHFFGNFGPGRPAGGGADRFDNGTSAATPVAAGVGALLLSVLGEVAPARLKEALIRSATGLGGAGWNAETGFGVINAAAALAELRGAQELVS
jgi:serine protease AprX